MKTLNRLISCMIVFMMIGSYLVDASNEKVVDKRNTELSDYLSENEEMIMNLAGKTELEGMELTLDESSKVEFRYISNDIYDLEWSIKKTIKKTLSDSLGYIIPLYNDVKILKGYIVVLQGEPIEYYNESIKNNKIDDNNIDVYNEMEKSRKIKDGAWYLAEVMPLPDEDIASEYGEIYFNIQNTVEMINEINNTEFKKYQVLRVGDYSNYLLYLTKGNQEYISPLNSSSYNLEKYEIYPSSEYFEGMENLKIDFQNKYFQIGGGIDIIGYQAKSVDMTRGVNKPNIVFLHY